MRAFRSRAFLDDEAVVHLNMHLGALCFVLESHWREAGFGI